VTITESVPAETSLLSLPLTLIFSESVARDTEIVKVMDADGSGRLPDRIALYAAMVAHTHNERCEHALSLARCQHRLARRCDPHPHPRLSRSLSRSYACRSPWHGYFAHLPGDVDVPELWSAEEQQRLLRGTNLGRALDSMALDTRSAFVGVAQRASQAAVSLGLDPSPYTADAFARCHRLAQSRAFADQVFIRKER
jgi:hypothetical protein